MTLARIAIPIETGIIHGAISKIAPGKHLFPMREARKLFAEIIFSGAKIKIAPETVADPIGKVLVNGAKLEIAPENCWVPIGFPSSLGAKYKIAPQFSRFPMVFLRCLMVKPRELIGNRGFLKVLAEIPSAFSREMMKDAFGFEGKSQNHMDNLRRALVIWVAMKGTSCEQPAF